MKTQILMAFLAIGIAGTIVSAKEASQKVILTVTENGFEPKAIDVKSGSDIVLEVTRKTDSTCAKEVQIPSKKIRVKLPLNERVTVSLGKLEKGEIRFGCGMNMMESGRIIVR
jgi:plastocyanin domain-containing protein